MLHFPHPHNSSTLTAGALLIKVFIEHLNVSLQLSAVSRAKLCLNPGNTTTELSDDILMKTFMCFKCFVVLCTSRQHSGRHCLQLLCKINERLSAISNAV